MDEWKLDRTQFQVLESFQEINDKAYWLAQSPEKRWEAVERLRQMNYNYDPASTRLQRISWVIKYPFG